MKILLWIFFVAGKVATSDNSNYYVIQMPQEDSHRTLTKQFRVYWNVPTMQCKSKGILFEHLYERYGILQNENDSFRGEKISILYDPGLFPALLKNESTGEYKFRNGGVPQEGNLEKHIASFKSTLEQSIPDPHFSGAGIIDFESWRPVFRQNFGVLVPYKDVSYQIERKKHWIWPEVWIKSEAKQRFEESARSFMQTTLSIARQMRPRAQWGYYGFPYCFNMAASNLRERCADRVPAENDDTHWLWSESTALYPSVYITNSLTTEQLAQMVRGRLREAARVRKSGTQILPYFWFRYHSTNGGYLSEANLQTAIKTIYESEASGFIIWGSSNDVNTGDKCKNLLKYIETQLGPEVVKYTKYDRTHSINDEDSTVTASNNHEESSTVNTSYTTDGSFASQKTASTTPDTNSSGITSSSTDRTFNSTLNITPTSDGVTILDDINDHKTLKSQKQIDREYYDDNTYLYNETTTKDVDLQLDPEYFWLQPQNYTHYIRKVVDDEIKRKSFTDNINLSDKITTEIILGNPFEIIPTLNVQTPNQSSHEDDLGKILIQSTTEDEFMEGVTAFTEKTSSYKYNVENYKSIDILHDDFENSTKRNSNDEKPNKTEPLNEKNRGELETFEVGSQFKDQPNEDKGSHDNRERILDNITESEHEAFKPNIYLNQDGFHHKEEQTSNTVLEDGFITVIPKTIENFSTSIQYDTVEYDTLYESTTVFSLPTFFNLYSSSKYVIPINKNAESEDKPVRVLGMFTPENNTMKYESDFLPSNLNVVEKEQSIGDSYSSIHHNDITSEKPANDSFLTNSSEIHVLNTTPADNLVFHKPSHMHYDGINTYENATIMSTNNNDQDNNRTSDQQNEESVEATTKNTTVDIESTTVNGNFTKDKENAKDRAPLQTFTSKNEKKGSTARITIEAKDATTKNPKKGDWNVPILSDQVSGSGAHRVGGFRYYYCIIFYFYSVSKCLCDYYGQCS